MLGPILRADDDDRLRLREAEERLSGVRNWVLVVMTPVMVAGVVVHGLRTFGLFLQPFLFALLDVMLRRSARPERWVLGVLLSSQVLYGAAIALTGGPSSPYLPLVTVTALALAPRFRPPVLITGTVITLGIVLLATVPVDPAGFVRDPLLVGTTLGVTVLVAAFSNVIVHAEIHQRAEATVDPLTGLLNRASLEARGAEIEAQAARDALPVSVVAIDLDGFKAVNDTLGHDHGDAVLRTVADALRREVREGDLVYRLGGDELLVLATDVQPAAGLAMAHRLRRAIAEAGDGVTGSVGVASAQGEQVRVTDLWRAADVALYHAKRAGGDRVVHATAPAVAAAQAA